MAEQGGERGADLVVDPHENALAHLVAAARARSMSSKGSGSPCSSTRVSRTSTVPTSVFTWCSSEVPPPAQVESFPDRLGRVNSADRTAANRRAARASSSTSSGGLSTVKSASRPSSTTTGHSSESRFISSRQSPSAPDAVPQWPTAAATSATGAATRTRTAYRCGIRLMPDWTNESASSAGQVARPEPLAGRARVADPVDPEGAPVLAVPVVGDEVPAAAEGDQPVRLDPAVGRARPREPGR